MHNPVFGGGVNQTLRLAPALYRRHDWETIMRVPDLPEAHATERRIREEGVPVERMELHRLRRSADARHHVALVASFRSEVRALRRLVRRERIDLVQAFGATNPHLALAGHLEGVAVVWSLTDSVLPPAAAAVPMRLVGALADVVLTTGDRLADLHPGARRLGERCIPVYPPVDLDFFRPDPEARRAARGRLGVPPGALLVGTVGNRNPTKGHEYFVRAAERFISDGGDAHFRVLGSPSPVHAAHMAAVDEQVRAAGLGDRLAFVDPGSRVGELLPAFDVFVLSSIPRSEGVPTVILEAMACGLPVVSTDVGAVREVVRDGATGFVVPPLDPPRMVDALRRLEEEGLRRSLGEEGRRRAEELYGTERCAEAYARAFSLAREHRAARRGS